MPSRPWPIATSAGLFPGVADAAPGAGRRGCDPADLSERPGDLKGFAGMPAFHVAVAHRDPRGAQGDPQAKGAGHVSLEEATEEADGYAPSRTRNTSRIGVSRRRSWCGRTKSSGYDDALAKLDEKHRLVFLLRDVEGLSVEGDGRGARAQRGQYQGAAAARAASAPREFTRTPGDPERRVARNRHNH